MAFNDNEEQSRKKEDQENLRSPNLKTQTPLAENKKQTKDAPYFEVSNDHDLKGTRTLLLIL